MGKELTDAQKIAKLRCSLATKASQVIKNRYITEYQEVYWNLLRDHGLQPTTNSNHMVLLHEENKKLKEVLKAMAAKGPVEVIEFEDDRSWNYPKPKEQEED
jgi:hypothetical protein